MAFLQIDPEVGHALRDGGAVVALESTIISHGLPRPDNLEIAREIEAVVRKEGAVPATIAVVSGVVRIGLGPDELATIATSPNVSKVSVRDLATLAARGGHGATTVASTSYLASRAGIPVFATGGLGGVHREARQSWDESADLSTLSVTPITVVCAGVKSILDVGATLERLETLNVGVVGYRTDSFPGFYLADSGYRLHWRVESPEHVASIMRARAELGTDRHGLVIANPLPVSEQLDPQLHERILRAGLTAAESAGVHGKDVTPFLLDFFHRESGGKSLRANIEIILRNARLAAQIAVAFAAGDPGDEFGGAAPVNETKILVVGDVMTDVITRVDQPFAVGSDTKAKVRTAGGGSGANTACWLAFLSADVTFCGRVGEDPFGVEAISALRSAGVTTAVSVDTHAPTGTCVVLVGSDGQRSMLPDAGANSFLAPDDIPAASLVDGGHVHMSGYTLLNPGSRATGREVLRGARDAGMTISVDASSAAPLEAVGPRPFLSWIRRADLLFCNADEALVLADCPDPGRAASLLTRHVPQCVVKAGAEGAWWAGRRSDPAFAASTAARIVDTTGAGDAFAAGFLNGWLDGSSPGASLSGGHRLAALAVAKEGARPE